MSKKPVVFDLEDDEAAPDVAAAPLVPDLSEAPTTTAMQQAAGLATRRPSCLARWFWRVLVALIGAVVSVAAWDFATGLILRVPVLGWAVTVGLGVALLLALLMGLRELAALARLRRVDGLRHGATAASKDLAAAQAYATRITRFYAHRDELS